jgi:hypothetical protein
MSALTRFNETLDGRARFERYLTSWGRPQYRDALGLLGVDAELKSAVQSANAEPQVSAAWEAFDDESESSKLYVALRGPVEKLFRMDPRPASNGDVATRLTTFATEVASALAKVQGDAGQPNGLVMALNVPIPSGADSIYPDLSLLDEQRKAVVLLIKAMGRQTGTKSWSEWFGEKFAAVKDGFPALVNLGATTGLSTIINKSLEAAAGHAVGLVGYSVVGFSGYVVTFGSNLLTPWQATYQFPKLMKTQSVLYRLHEYGDKRLQLPASHRVMKALQASTDSIDWSAVQTAFKVTPFGLLVSVYGGVKWLALKAKPQVGAYYNNAKDLIDAADTLQTGETKENRLAMLTILHLCGGLEKFVQVMTCRREDAYSTLSGMIDV